MQTTTSSQLNRIFAALSDPTRRAIVARLAKGEVSVGELAEPFAMSGPAISKHLKVLEKAGLLDRRIEGRVHHCSLIPGPLQSASAWIETYRAFWNTQFDALEAFLEQTTPEQAPENQDHPAAPSSPPSPSKPTKDNEGVS